MGTTGDFPHWMTAQSQWLLHIQLEHITQEIHTMSQIPTDRQHESVLACFSLSLQSYWEIMRLKEITDTSTFRSSFHLPGKYSHLLRESKERVLFGLFLRQINWSRGVWPGADKVRSRTDDLKPAQSPVQRRLMPTSCFWDPSDEIKIHSHPYFSSCCLNSV